MMIVPHIVVHAVGKIGYLAVGFTVGAESAGVPLPGETALVAASLYAGATQHLNIFLLVTVAAISAIIGDNIGFWIGRAFGFRLLLRYGHVIRMTEPRIKLGQYLFQRHGGKVVFFGRFIAVLRPLAAFLAGANRMAWGRFLVCNAAGAVIWASVYGFGAYYLGTAIDRLLGPVGIGIGAAAVLGLVTFGVFLHRNEKRLEAEAERALPGPVRAARHRRVALATEACAHNPCQRDSGPPGGGRLFSTSNVSDEPRRMVPALPMRHILLLKTVPDQGFSFPACRKGREGSWDFSNSSPGPVSR